MVLGLSLCVLAAEAADWPQWRGPKRDGVSSETGLLKSWPSGGPSLAWQTAGLGGGYASVSVSDKRIYTMGDGPDMTLLIALEEATGKKLWAARVGRPGGGGGYPGPRCTPTVDGERVYALGQYGDLICVETGTGKEIWRKDLLKDFAGKVMSGWGYSESPLVDGDKLILTPGGPQGTVIALDKKSGATFWRTKELTDPAGYSSVIVEEIGQVRQYIQITDSHVAGIEAQTGKVLWSASRRGRTAVIPTPIYHDQHVYVTSGYNVGCNLFKITPAGGTFTAQQVYANGDMVNHHGGVIRVGNHVYGYSDGDGWTCQEFKTGKVAWVNKQLDKGSIVFADGHFYLRSESGRGTVALIEANPKAYIEKARFDQPKRSGNNSWAHPVIANGKLYLRDQDLLLCFDVTAKPLDTPKR